MIKLQELKRSDLKIGDLICAKVIRTGEIHEGKVHQLNNGFGQVILQRLDDENKCMVWDIENPTQRIIFYRKDVHPNQ